MKTLNTLLLIAFLCSGTSALAESLLDDAGTLGGNKELINKARAIDPNNRVRIVQNRLVDRRWRLELGVNYGAFAGGDPYLETDQLGGSVDLHVNPMLSVGFRYYNHSNTLSTEGQRRFDEAQAARELGIEGGSRPDIDQPLSSYMGVINLYPTYGKLNLFDYSVAQFDVYLLGGVGQMQLESGTAPTYTAGGGLGLWLSNHFTTRIEARYQTYEDRAFDGSTRGLDITIFSASLGVML
ncbi:MAG: outer membrane beta-barrel domain-containing protein [Bdellovibrionales bacterium]|nr:outer membrane beta-barrel domain-containing protein [Bdellovibrionales bacterium]